MLTWFSKLWPNSLCTSFFFTYFVRKYAGFAMSAKFYCVSGDFDGLKNVFNVWKRSLEKR